MTTCTIVALIVRCTLAGPVLSPADAAVIVARLPAPVIVLGIETRLPPSPYVAPTRSRQSRQVPYQPHDPSPGRIYRPAILPTSNDVVGVVILTK